MMHEDDFTPEEFDRYQHEVTRVAMLWNNFMDEMADSNIAYNVHPPLALNSLFRGILDNAQDGPLSTVAQAISSNMHHSTQYTELIDVLRDRIMIGFDAMFRFGQYCCTHALIHEDLIRCK